MRNNPWFPFAVCLLCGTVVYLLIVTVGCGVVNTAADGLANQSEEIPTATIALTFGYGAITSSDETKIDQIASPFADDRAGQLLSEQLLPSEKLPATVHDAPVPRHLPPPAYLEQPSPPLPPA